MNDLIITICSGGSLGEWALPYIKQASYIIGADRGAQFLIQHGFTPNISLGDFDSVNDDQLISIKNNSKQFIDVDAVDKDYTDTHLAYIHALEQHPKKILIVGALGSRYDHTLANLQLLDYGLKHDITTVLIDERNRIQMMNPACSALTVSKDNYRYISLLSYTEQVTGVTLQGFKYPLTDATLTRGHSIGISNELLNTSGTIQISSGKLLVIQAND